MKKMQKCLSAVVMIVAVVVSFSSVAQIGGGGLGRGGMPPNMEGGRNAPEPPDPEKMVDQEVKWMKKKLKLSPEQTDHVTDISTKYAFAQLDLRQKNMNKGSGSRPSEKEMKLLKERIDALMAEKDKEMSLVLAPKQFEKYLKRREDLAKSLEKNTPKGNGGPPSGGPQGGGRVPF